jgi:hypothetical protein
MRKEVQINGKWYWTLEATDQNQAFNPPEPAYMWDDSPKGNAIRKENKLGFVLKNRIGTYPFKTEECTGYAHCALLSSEHEKKSRRATNIEVMKWCSTNGVWLDEYNQVRNDPLDANLSELKNPCKECVLKVVKWDGSTMEPTAKNMGLEE